MCVRCCKLDAVASILASKIGVECSGITSNVEIKELESGDSVEFRSCPDQEYWEYPDNETACRAKNSRQLSDFANKTNYLPLRLASSQIH